jgi:hypothetical protein
MNGFNIYFTPHPHNGKAHAGTAIIIKSRIKHSLLEGYTTDHIQATTIRLEDRSGLITLSAVYCPPKHKITQQMFENYFASLGSKFIAGGDWNAKHTFWGSRITLPRGRSLKNCLDANHLSPISSGEPTSWPTDPKKIPDLLDFFITKGIGYIYSSVESNLDGSSDHTPVILTLNTTALNEEPPETLTNHKTDWEGFQSYLTENINLKLPLKTLDDVDNACEHITNLIQISAWKNTPFVSKTPSKKPQSGDIKSKLQEKRRLRKSWHQSHRSKDKTAFNRAAKQLKALLEAAENARVRNTLEKMTPQGKGEMSLWKATKITGKPQQSFPPLRSPTSWARTDAEKAEVFAEHLAKVFKPNKGGADESDVDEILLQDFQMCPPITPASPKEIAREIRTLDPNKAPGFDLITPKVLKKLPKKCITFLTSLFNAILRTSHIPKLWKISQIIMIHKAGKPPHEAPSYRPISLTPVLSKLWEKIFVARVTAHLDDHEVIPKHQFGFRKSHSTIEQMHRVYKEIRRCFERKLYCSAAFLDVQQAFDRVWHKGLLCKVKLHLPHTMYVLIKSYLSDRLFQVKHGNARSNLHKIEAGVPQGSVLGPVLYNIFTSDLPTTEDVTVATYADDVAYLASDEIPEEASNKLQNVLDKTHTWLEKWRIRPSAQKSNHITFTLRKKDSPPVRLGSTILPDTNCVKYLGFHLDRRLTWKLHIKKKRDEINLKCRSLYWLLGRNSVLSVDNKLLIYNSVLKPIWTYGIPLWSTASKSNILCLQRVQNGILRTIANAPWFSRNEDIHKHLEVPTIQEEIERHRKKYAERLTMHPNPLATQLLQPVLTQKRLKRKNVL